MRQCRGLSTFTSNVLHNINEETCHAAFAFSLLTSFIVLATPHPVDGPIEQVLALRSHFQGSATIAISMAEILKQGPMQHVLEANQIDWNLQPGVLE